MEKNNPAHIKRVLDFVNRAPYFQLLSMKICEVSTGYSRMEAVLEKKHMNPFGAAHGGVYCSLIDAAAFWAVYCELAEDTGYTSLDLSVDYLYGIREGKMIIEGSSLKIGRSICIAEAAVRDAGGKLLARGTSKLMITEGTRSISRMMEDEGQRGLPAKFIR